MREDYGSLNLVTHDDGFGDMGFDTDNPDIMREAIGNEGGLEQVNTCFLLTKYVVLYAQRKQYYFFIFNIYYSRGNKKWLIF